MASTLDSLLLDSLLDSFQRAASTLPDARTGSNTCHSVVDAALSALAPFFCQDPSFLAFQRRMQDNEQRSNCQSLFRIQRIPTDNCIRYLLDGCPTAAFDDVFHDCLDTLANNGALQPFQRLDGRLLVALDGIQIHCSDKIHCPQCSVRHVGKDKTPQYFHTMVSASVVADGHSRVLPLMPEFVQPQQDPAARDPSLSRKRQKQDCELNAGKRWISRHARGLAPHRPVLLGDDLYCCQPICQLAPGHQADFLFVCKPNSHKALYRQLPNRRIWSTKWQRTRNRHKQVECHRYRWRNNVPLRGGDDALKGTWVDFQIRRNGKRTYRNSFFTSLTVHAGNVAAIARAGRARWKIENETFNCLARHGYNLKHNFGHGKAGLANLLAVTNLLAFAFHCVLDSVRGLWRRLRDMLGTRRDFFHALCGATRLFVFPGWTALLETLLKERPPPPLARGPTPAPG